MSANSKIIVTRYSEKIYCYHVLNDVPTRLFISKESKYKIGDIIVGRVQTVKKDLKASFIELDKDTIGFLPDSDINPEGLLNRSYDGRLKQGDLIAVQIKKEPIKTKPFSLSMNLNIVGSYSIIHNENSLISVSNKLDTKTKTEFKNLIESKLESISYGIIVRTNADLNKKEDVLQEVINNKAILSNIINIMRSRTCYSILYKANDAYINEINMINKDEYDEIITDDTEIYSALQNIRLNKSVRLYQDDKLSLKSLYSLDKVISDATNKKINLKSGGYLVIEPTEALTVIDVNSGKASFKNKALNIHSTNLEAASEIANQIKLRNISGIIIVDFINYNKSDKQLENELLDYLKKTVSKDSVKTNIIGFTSLGLVEITREKKYASIYEMM